VAISHEVVKNSQRDREVDSVHLVDAIGADGITSSAKCKDVDELLMDCGQLNPQQCIQARCILDQIAASSKHLTHLGRANPNSADTPPRYQGRRSQ
jgi:hypothetical protein